MQHRKVLWLIILSLVAMFLVVNYGLAQGPAKEPGAQSAPKKEAPKITLVGKIMPEKATGGYLVISTAPHEEYRIINVDEKTLGDLVKKGVPVTIEGRLPRGAFFLLIEKINDEPYPVK
jgi:hypothetical protein